VTPRASLARRLASLAYETLIVCAIALVTGFALAPLVTPARAGLDELQVPGVAERVMLFCAMFAACAFYFVGLWSDGRRTLPMKTWRLRIVDVRGNAIERSRALARYVAAWIGPALAIALYAALRPRGLGAHAVWVVALNFLWALIDRDRQFLHDRIVRTRIVND
jgi:uncharacterized RDD family membrane protein YckC